MRVRLNWWLTFLLFTAHGLLNFMYVDLDWAARAHPISFLIPFLEQMTGHYTAFLLFPALVVFVRHFPLQKRRWFTLSLGYLAVLVAFSVIHTALNALSRDILFPLFGLGSYDYGIMRVRYWMEFPSDVFLFTIMVGTLYGLDFYQKSKQKELAASQLQTRLTQAQLQNLRLQLQPHFLFNALNTISAAMYEDVRAADEMISRLGEFLRLTVSSSPAQEVRLSEELHFLELYLDIMRARFEDKLLVRMDIESGLDNALVPQLILQPLIENSIRHGVEPLTGRVHIDVAARRSESGLHLEVRDHGVGIHEAKGALLTRGIGLSNTADRLDRLYGPEHQLDFANASGGGLVVSVAIPFHQ